MLFDGVAGDRRLFVATIKDTSGVVQDVTGWTAVFRYSFDGAATIERGMSILGAAVNGQFQYEAIAGEMVAGTMRAEVRASDASSKQWTQIVEIMRKFRGAV